MSLVIGLLTFVLVVTCLLLMLLVLIQLPKKEAGAGVAFGGGATDALFGAGSGNALTQVTKYAATVFLGLSMVLAILNSRLHERSSLGIEQELSRQSGPAQVVTPPPAVTTQPQPLQPLTSNPAEGNFEPLVPVPAPGAAEGGTAPAATEATTPAQTPTPAATPAE